MANLWLGLKYSIILKNLTEEGLILFGSSCKSVGGK